MDLISVRGGSPAGRQPAIRGISSSHRACKHTHTHKRAQSRPPHRESQNGKYYQWPQTDSVSRHPAPWMLPPQPGTFSASLSAPLQLLSLSLPLRFSAISLSASGLHYLHLPPPRSLPLLLIVSHYHSLPFCWGGGARGFLSHHRHHSRLQRQ